jgi:hypothetical protein
VSSSLQPAQVNLKTGCGLLNGKIVQTNLFNLAMALSKKLAIPDTILANKFFLLKAGCQKDNIV